MNEFEEMLAIEKERAKERQEELGRNQGEDPSGNISQRGDEGRARDKAAEKINADVFDTARQNSSVKIAISGIFRVYFI